MHIWSLGLVWHLWDEWDVLVTTPGVDCSVWESAHRCNCPLDSSQTVEVTWEQRHAVAKVPLHGQIGDLKSKRR